MEIVINSGTMVTINLKTVPKSWAEDGEATKGFIYSQYKSHTREGVKVLDKESGFLFFIPWSNILALEWE